MGRGVPIHGRLKSQPEVESENGEGRPDPERAVISPRGGIKKTKRWNQKKLAPGFEPGTSALRKRCSAN